MCHETIASAEAPAAIGPYSQAVASGNHVFVSGQLGLEPKSGNLASGIEGQTRQALSNLRAILYAAGLGLDHVVKTTIFLVDLADFSVVNAVYGEHFSSRPPARSTVQVAALPKSGLIEIEAIAVRPPAESMA